MFRHRFQGTQFTRMFYDILTCLTTRIVLCYCVFPFVLLDFMSSANLYLKFYCGLHISALIVMYLLPRFLSGEQRGQAQRAKKDDILLNSTSKCIENTSDLNATNLQTKLNVSATTKPFLAATPSANINGLKNRRIAAGSENKVIESASLPIKEVEEKVATKLPQTNLNSVLKGNLAHHVPHDKCEMDQLSSKFKQKIDAEAKNIEEFIDKTVNETVSGIVGFKRELMRDCNFPAIIKTPSSSSLQQQQQQQQLQQQEEQYNLRKRLDISNGLDNENILNDEGSAVFLKKEIDAINAVVQQANNMFPAVISNGHAK